MTEKTVFEVVRDARCAKGMTQSALASAAGCKQSAISMFEGGRVDALSQKNLAGIAEHLGLDVKTLTVLDQRPVTARSLVLKYCMVDDCPSNIPYPVRGRISLAPAMVEAPASEKTRCASCGDVLEDRCPNESCRAGLNAGAYCRKCGTPYVTCVREPQDDPGAWSAAVRARISELRTMTRTERFTVRSTADTSRSVENDQQRSGGKSHVEKTR